MDEENICSSHDKMPDCHHSDLEDRIESDAEVDGMMETKEMPDMDQESEFSENDATTEGYSDYSEY